MDDTLTSPRTTAAFSASDALCRFSGRNADTLSGLLARYMASDEIVADDETPEPTGDAAAALLRARIAFRRLPRAQQLLFIRHLAQEYAFAEMTREHTPAPITTPTA